ncbi:hypothetical protein Q0812_13255 [Brevundimonas sp. 2R-24]|uniref:Uncharacterized protein n=1 Tax=Peiella sedimenti TaxID=3061083 RepID=A0ABT8SP80_9CAUL|nr:hypothetical protein [Caulobacteraceae bacterium XZ-24]
MMQADLSDFLNAATTGDGPIVRATVQEATVSIETSGLDHLPVARLGAPFRGRPFVARGRILFEVEEGGRVVRSVVFEETAAVEGSTTTDERRAASTAAAIAEWRQKAFARIEREVLARYLNPRA